MARLPEPIDAYPATYRHHVYYCAGAEERAEFLSHPVMYVAEAPPVPEVNTCVSVVGPPCSGKTSVSTRLAKQLGVPLLSAAAALAAAATANDALGVAVRPAKRRLSFAPFNAKNVIILPRQARDKHRENIKKRALFLAGADGDSRGGRHDWR